MVVVFIFVPHGSSVITIILYHNFVQILTVRPNNNRPKHREGIFIGPTRLGNGMADIEDLAVLGEYWLKEVLPDCLIVGWKRDETEGFVVHDSASDHDGFVVSENPVWRPTDGKIEGALELEGIDDYVSTLFVLNPADGAFSVLAWTKGGAPGH
jgi:hypothetical protein